MMPFASLTNGVARLRLATPDTPFASLTNGATQFASLTNDIARSVS